MTNREKAESCGEYVRDGLDCLDTRTDYGQPGTIFLTWTNQRDQIVEGARQAGHWGRLALEQTGD